MIAAVILFLLFLSVESNEKPNFLLIVTDDQDSILHGMFPLRKVQELIGDAGAVLNNAFTTSPLCCPSRASLLSGLYAHNHRTFNNSLSGGCNDNHWRNHIETKSLPAILRNAGYDTFFAGKYLNQYYGKDIPVGWNDFHGLHGNSRYYNYTLRENEQNINYTDTYLTDLLRDLSLDFLSKRVNNKTQEPFFAMICPPAPHQPFTPAERHRNVFVGIKALRTPNFNALSKPWEKHWLVANSETMNAGTIELVDSYFEKRWETLLAVDEMVADILKALETSKELENTYVIYTSDNGYHMGQFAQPFDKRQPYETDIRVPLLVRGPGITHGLEIDAPVALIDLMPTILDWANIPIPINTDGKSLKTILSSSIANDAYEHRSLLIQHWGEGNSETYNSKCPWKKHDFLAGCTTETNCHCEDSWNNTYACVRHFRKNIDRLYCEFRDNENFVETYDLIDDPFQLKNIVNELLPIEQAFYSLALSNLTTCAGATCNNINI